MLGRANPDVPLGAAAFTIHEKAGHAQLFALLPLAVALEILPVHLLLRNWSEVVAWTATVLSIYCLFWAINVARSFRLRPSFATQDYIRLRYGLLLDLRVPREKIARIRNANAEDSRFAVPRNNPPSICIEFTDPLAANGPFGARKRFDRIAFTPDDRAAFERSLAVLNFKLDS